MGHLISNGLFHQREEVRRQEGAGWAEMMVFCKVSIKVKFLVLIHWKQVMNAADLGCEVPGPGDPLEPREKVLVIDCHQLQK